MLSSARACFSAYLAMNPRVCRAGMLVEAVPAEASSYCRVETVMVHGSPWRVILREAGERNSEVIVMGVQGRGAADLMFFGSTTQHVVRQATCPVLTIKAL